MAEYGQHPDFWIELFVRYASVVEPYAFGFGPYADPQSYHWGWKPPAIKDIGAIERAASNSDNQAEAGILQVGFYDFDDFFRFLYRDPAKGAVLGYELLGYIVSRRARKAQQDPTLVHRGFVNDRGLPAGKLAALTSQDAVGSQFGPYGYDRKIPDVMIGPNDFDYAPPAIAGKQAAPMAYGPWTDKGTVLEDGTPYEKGRLPVYYVGNFVLGDDGSVTPGSEAPQPQLLPPPPAPTHTTFGPGGDKTFTFAVSARTAGGRTTLGAPLTVSGLPALRTPTNGIILHLAQYSAELQAQVVGAHLYVKEGTATSSNPWHFVDGAGEMFNTAADDPFPAGPNYTSGGVGFEANGDDSFNKSYNPPPTANTATITIDMGGGVTGVRNRGFLVTRGRFEVTGIYASPVNADQTLGEGRVLVTDGSFTAPEVVTINGRDYTVFYGFGPRADFAAQGRLSVAVNGCGYTVSGAAGSPMIGTPFDQMVRLLNDFVFHNNGFGWQGGPWPPYEMFPGSTDVQIINVDSFKACAAYYAAKLGHDPIGAVYINQQVTLREILRQFMQDTSCFTYPDRYGRVSCGIIDETTDFTNAQRLRDRIEIQAVETPIYDEPGMFNRHHYVFDYDPDLSQYRLPPRVRNHAGSQSFYRRVVEAPLHEFRFSNDEDFVEAVMAHEEMIAAFTPVYYPIRVSYAPGLNLDIGQPVLVTNDEHKFVDRKMIIMRHNIHSPSSEGAVTLMCLDVENIMIGDVAPPVVEPPPDPDEEPPVDPGAPPEDVPEPPGDIDFEFT